MPNVDPREALRALNGWARVQGYFDFDTYIASGGSFATAVADITKRRRWLDLAMVAIYQWKPPAPPVPPPVKSPELTGADELEDYERASARMTIGEDALRAAEADVTGEPIDPDNAHPQGIDV